jgi:hypothetical protein
MIDEKRAGHVRMDITVPPQYRKRLQQESYERGLTMSEIIRRAIDALLGSAPTPRDSEQEESHEQPAKR